MKESQLLNFVDCRMVDLYAGIIVLCVIANYTMKDE